MAQAQGMILSSFSLLLLRMSAEEVADIAFKGGGLFEKESKQLSPQNSHLNSRLTITEGPFGGVGGTH